MGKVCTGTLMLGVAGAIIGMQIYTCMSPKHQREIQKGLKDIVEDLRDVTDRLCSM